ncbi:hypothetical protein [Kitasatospora sp. NPDC057223]|uniref:hypothetical protein n=1 Tax=Kitasatospora sp. NPDC057223 TaxID=3346055 RepID=UPI003635D137
MGIYLVSVDADEWSGEDEGGLGEVAAALNAELAGRGLGPYASVPRESAFVRGAGQCFEEKLVPPMDGFLALCRRFLSVDETEDLCGWTVLVPVALGEPVVLPVPSAHDEATTVAGAPRALAAAEKLAAAVGLPDGVPVACDNLDLTTWFLDGSAEQAAAARPGPWSEDLDAAFYTALYLRAAQHSLRRGCPVRYS